jgi:hypothetical protein
VLHAVRTKFRGAALAMIIFASTTIAALTVGALAGTVQLSGTHSESDIQSHCTAAGGVFFGSTSSDSGYGCTAAGGSVNCNKAGECSGECATCGKGPATAHGGKTIFGVLSGTTLKKLGTRTPTKTMAESIRARRPMTIERGPIETETHHGRK